MLYLTKPNLNHLNAKSLKFLNVKIKNKLLKTQYQFKLTSKFKQYERKSSRYL